MEQQPLGGAGLGGQRGGVCEDIEAAVSECPGARLAGDWWFPEAPEVLKQMRVTTSMTRPIKGATGRKVRPQYSLCRGQYVHIQSLTVSVILRHSWDHVPGPPAASRGTASWSGLRGN